jgi:hypothetical protein
MACQFILSHDTTTHGHFCAVCFSSFVSFVSKQVFREKDEQWTMEDFRYFSSILGKSMQTILRADLSRIVVFSLCLSSLRG